MDERPIEDIEFVITWTVQQEDGSIRTYQVGPYASPDTAASEIADWWVMPEVGTTISAEISAKPDDWKRDEDVRELSVVSADEYQSNAEVRASRDRFKRALQAADPFVNLNGFFSGEQFGEYNEAMYEVERKDRYRPVKR